MLQNIWQKLLKKQSKLLLLFLPLSILGDLLYRLRRFFYNYGPFKRISFAVPIISIGNLGLGGSGKTPMTLYLANAINQRNKKIAILMRGHKGKFEHSAGVLKTGTRLGHDPIDFGDEAIIYARNLKNASIIVGKKRANNLDYYFSKERPDAVLLDDGFQHLKIFSDLDIVLFDATWPLSYYKSAPVGYFREGLSALKYADYIAIGRVDLVTREKLEQIECLLKKYIRDDVQIGYFKYQFKRILDCNFKNEQELSGLRDQKVVTVTGLASPDSFNQMISALDAKIIQSYSFSDHHYYTESELNKIISYADENNAIILTTEKDVVKIRKVVNNNKIFFLEIELQFVKEEESLKLLVDNLVLS